MANLHISISAEPLLNIGPLIFSNSLLLSLIVTGFLFIFAFWFNAQVKAKTKSNLYYLSLSSLTTMYNFFENVAGPKVKQFFPLLATFFLYIIFSNWSGLLPGVGTIGFYEFDPKKIFVPFLRGPTADINTTLALAIITICAMQYFGITSLGFGKYIKKYINLTNPINFFVGLLEIVSDLSKAISFAFRLFGNIFAGEVLLMVMGAIFPFLAPLPFLGLEIFIGFIQALVFTMLSLVFISVATVETEH